MPQFHVFVGTYSPAGEQGIHLLRLDAVTGQLVRIGGAYGIDNASFLTVDAPRRLLFAVSETEDGAVTSYRYDLAAGTITELSRQATNGAAPCYISLDRSGCWLFTVNYSSGSVVVYPVTQDGIIGEAVQHVQHSGSSIRPDRQEGAHPHAIINVPASSYWLIPDLGTDSLYMYRFDAMQRQLSERTIVRTESGAGPRHAVFHPSKPFIYVINELDSTIASYHYDKERAAFALACTVPTLPDDFDGESTCADIHIDETGTYLYGSNRGHDSVAVFRTLEQGGLTPLGHVSTLGRTPRNFTLVPGTPLLLAANQDSDSIVVFRIAEETGIPHPTECRLEVSKPVCLHVVTDKS